MRPNVFFGVRKWVLIRRNRTADHSLCTVNKKQVGMYKYRGRPSGSRAYGIAGLTMSLRFEFGGLGSGVA